MSDWPKKVVIFGGIHGNEMSGIHVVKNWQKKESSEYPSCLQRSGLSQVRVVLANEVAVGKCLRFVDSDLNAAFGSNLKAIVDDQGRDAKAEECRNVEADIAAKLFKEFAGSDFDFCVHLHCATSNSGILFLVSKDDAVALKVAQQIQKKFTDRPVRVVVMDPRPTSLRALFPRGIGIEVGPQPQGILLSEMFQLHQEVISKVLDSLSQLAMTESAQGELSEGTIEVFQPVEVIPFPRDESGDLKAAIHSNLQGKDFQLLAKGTPIFKDFQGTDILYEGEDTYPIFVNESAYYSRDSAFWKTKKIQLKIKS